MTMSNSTLDVVILAAGKGQRMQSMLAKVLHPIGGEPMLAHVIKAAQTLNPEQIIVVYGHAGDSVKQAFNNVPLTWVEQTKQLGTAHAIQQTLPNIKAERVLILYGDVPLITSNTLKQFMLNTPADALGLITAHVPNPQGLGRIIRDNQQVLKIVEEKETTQAERLVKEINSGIWLVPTSYLKNWLTQLTNQNSQQEYYLTDLVEISVAQGVPIYTTQPNQIEEITGINDRVQLNQVERYYQVQRAIQLLKQGVEILDLNRFDVRGTLVAEPGVQIDINVIFQGHNLIGKNSKIGAHCILIDCEIGDEVTILPYSHLEQVTVGHGAQIGPFARLRPDTHIGQNARIGNFVEIKNAQIGHHSKINHLSYIGDTHMGQFVNIGAGTITCNYDGAYKHQTIIEDNAYIGANSQLIAPVMIGTHATIGAGSTLTQDAPAHQLTLTQVLKIRSKIWQRPQKPQQQGS